MFSANAWNRSLMLPSLLHHQTYLTKVNFILDVLTILILEISVLILKENRLKSFIELNNSTFYFSLKYINFCANCIILKNYFQKRNDVFKHFSSENYWCQVNQKIRRIWGYHLESIQCELYVHENVCVLAIVLCALNLLHFLLNQFLFF